MWYPADAKTALLWTLCLIGIHRRVDVRNRMSRCATELIVTKFTTLPTVLLTA